MPATAERDKQTGFPVFWFSDFTHTVMVEQVFKPEEALNNAAWKDKDPAGFLVKPNTSIVRIENTADGQKKVIRDAYDVMLDPRLKTDEARQHVVERLKENKASFDRSYFILKPQTELIVTTLEEIQARALALARKMVDENRSSGNQSPKPAG